MIRIQRSRQRGWRMPAGAVYVGRPTKWGNRFRVDDDLGRDMGWDRAIVTELFRIDIGHRDEICHPGEPSLTEFLAPLRGRDLVCWCPLDQPCHADVLLELANR